jgi:hypothetical protein
VDAQMVWQGFIVQFSYKIIIKSMTYYVPHTAGIMTHYVP